MSLPARHTCKKHSAVLVIKQILTKYVHYIVSLLQHQLGALVNAGASASSLLYSHSKRVTVNKIVLSFQNKTSLQQLLQNSACKDVNSINFQKSPKRWVQICTLVSCLPHSSPLPHAWSQEFALCLPEMACIAAGKIHLLQYAKCVDSYMTAHSASIH